MTRLRCHLAFHYLGPVSRTSDGVVLKNLAGPLIEELAEHVDRVTVIGFDPPAHSRESADLGTYVARPSRNNIEVCSIGPKGSWRDWPQRRRRIKAIVGPASTAWDVLVFRMVNRRAGLVFGPNRCPRIVTITGGHEPSVIRAMPLPRFERLLRLALAWRSDAQFRRIARASGLVFGNSELLMRIYRRSLPQMRLLRTAVRRKRHSHRQDDRLGKSTRIVYLGRAAAEKGVLDAVEAFIHLAPRLPDAELHIIGAGNALAEVERRAKLAGLYERLHLHGWMTPGLELYSLLASMDVMLFLSHAESLPDAVWEAMGNSVLVVSTPVGALPDVFAHERELLFTPLADPAAAAAAVVRLADDPELRRKLLASAFARAEESTVERIAAELVANVAARWPEVVVA